MPSFGHGGPGGQGAPEKAKNFGKTLRKLLSYWFYGSYYCWT